MQPTSVLSPSRRIVSTVYIAGPMSGLEGFNYPAFEKAAIQWRQLGADAIALLPGWGNSRGARFELHLAQLLGLKIHDAETLEEFVPARVLTSLARKAAEHVPETILEEAQRLVHGNRGADYGHPIEDYTRTGRLWGALLGIPDIDPRICCLMMAAMKLVAARTIREQINALRAKGLIEQFKVQREGSDGRQITVNAYRILRAKK